MSSSTLVTSITSSHNRELTTDVYCLANFYHNSAPMYFPFPCRCPIITQGRHLPQGNHDLLFSDENSSLHIGTAISGLAHQRDLENLPSSSLMYTAFSVLETWDKQSDPTRLWSWCRPKTTTPPGDHHLQAQHRATYSGSWGWF